MGEEGAPHTLTFNQAETQTLSGGSMQLQASADTEETRVSNTTQSFSPLFLFLWSPILIRE